MRLRNVQPLDDKVLLMLTPGDASVSALPNSSLAIGDVLLLRPENPNDGGVLWLAVEAGDGLRATVVRTAPFSIGLELEFESTEAAAAEGFAPEQLLWKIYSGAKEQGGVGVAEGVRRLALAKALLGEKVRVDALGIDETHKRNVNALRSLRNLAAEAVDGRRLAATGIAAALYGDAQLDALPESTPTTSPPAAFFDTRLDESQQQSVASALAPSEALAVLQGPPGTGKTSTIVEIVRQATERGERVLVSAASNMAVDLLTLRLCEADPALNLVRVGNPERIDVRALDVTPEKVAEARVGAMRAETATELRRLLAELEGNGKMQNKRKSQMRSFLKRHMDRNLEKRIANGEREALRAAQVVLCTTTAAADPAILELPPFDLAVLDEASQATQPNAWLPLLRARRATLVGDPQQLPPTVLSREAKEGGLSESLMEQAIAARPETLCRLSTQRRMHRHIAAWVSRQSYDDGLETCTSVSGELLNNLPGVLDTAETRKPLFVVDVRAGGARGGESRSAGGAIINAAEARAVVAHVSSLLSAGVRPEDIAAISPYSAQVEAIRSLLAARAAAPYAEHPEALTRVEVATVDSFQGREAEAVVISMVRSNARGVIGFLADRRRLNVAVSRARRHLAVVGDSRTLGQHELFSSLLEHCKRYGSLVEME